jgi:hypothetical protein
MPSSSISTPRSDERDHWVHVHRNAQRRVQRDRGPDQIDITLRDIMALQEVARGIRAVDFEALGLWSTRTRSMSSGLDL